jgi:hypothetical protein
MNYTKPEVAVLGQAVAVIEGSTSKPGNYMDAKSTAVTPAYDLDE